MNRINLQAMAMELNLTNLQIVTLNGMADDIKNEKEDYFSVKGSLSEQEDKYLRARLFNEVTLLLKDERGGTSRRNGGTVAQGTRGH